MGQFDPPVSQVAFGAKTSIVPRAGFSKNRIVVNVLNIVVIRLKPHRRAGVWRRVSCVLCSCTNSQFGWNILEKLFIYLLRSQGNVHRAR